MLSFRFSRGLLVGEQRDLYRLDTARARVLSSDYHKIL